ncbi:MAG: nitroreductase family protein [Candidatus Thorarchaeota archaeon]|nr:MAG: nitroreductase family protein [Candidatus Thorarchaeota archaeon]
MLEGIHTILREIEERRSGRAYDPDKPVSDEMINSILEAGRRAPSCGNAQAWNFIVIRDPAVREKANEGMSRGNYWAARAPVMIIVAARPDGGCPAHKLPYFMMDVGLAVENMLLQGVHLGLIAHPTAGWREEVLGEVIGLPEEYRIAAVVFFGFEGDASHLSEKHLAQEQIRSPRRPFEEVVHWDRWQL